MAADLKAVIKKVAAEARTAEHRPEETAQLVVFELDGEEYAVEITEVREIIKPPEITPVPGAPEFIRGIFNLRGKIVVVIDMEKRFRLVREHPAESRHVIISLVGETHFGVMVDQVTEVVRIPARSIKPPPPLVSSKIRLEYLKGVAVLSESEDRPRLLILLDLPKMLQEKELLGVSEAVREAVKSLE